LFIADDNEAIASLILSLLEKPDVQADIGKRARVFVAAHYQWQPSMDKLISIWKK